MDAASKAISAFTGTSTNETQRLATYKNPSVQDVLAVKNILSKTSRLPLEIIDIIVDFAEYWPCASVTMQGEKYAEGGENTLINKEDAFLVRNKNLFYLPCYSKSE